MIPEVRFFVWLNLKREDGDPEGLYRIDEIMVKVDIPFVFINVRCSGVLVVDYEKVPDPEEVHPAFRREVRFDQNFLAKITYQVEEKMKRNGELLLDLIKSELNLPLGDEDVTAHITLREVPEENKIEILSNLYARALRTVPFSDYNKVVRKLVDRFVFHTKELVESSVDAVVELLNQKNLERELLRERFKNLGFSVRSIRIGRTEVQHKFEILYSEVSAKVYLTSGPKQPAIYDWMIESWNARQFLLFLTTFCFPFRELAYPTNDFVKIEEVMREAVKNEEVPVSVKVRLNGLKDSYGREVSKEIELVG